MKCLKCGTEWSSTVSNEFTSCPFCGEPLVGTIPHHQVIDAIKALIERFGIEIYSDEQRLSGLLNDVLPNALREKNILKTVVALGVPRVIASIKSRPELKDEIIRQGFETLLNGGLDASWCASAIFMIAYPLGVDSSNNYPLTLDSESSDVIVPNSSILFDEKVETEYAEKSMEELSALCLVGDAIALTELGDRYYHGKGIDKDETLAVSYFLQAAESEYAVAEFIVGRLYEDGRLLNYDPKLVMDYFQKSADKGYAPAQYALGQAYYLGQICEKNDMEAISWMLKSIEEVEDSDVYVSLALVFRDSNDNSVKNPEKAFQYAKLAADMEDENAYNLMGSLYELGCGVEQNYEKAFYFYKLAAEHGDEYAYLSIGAFYQTGLVVKQDYCKSAEYFQYGARVGNMYCLNALGICYKNGTGVNRDEKKAFELFLNAAYAGNPAGELNVAIAYFEGSGVEQDKNEAKKWFSIAANHGVSQAMFMLGVYAEQGWTDNSPDLRKAFEWYLKAATVGDHALAAWIIGNCYTEGLFDIEIDKCAAFEWYLKAAELGHPTAQNNIATAFFLGEIVDLDYQSAIEWYEKSVEQNDVYALDNYGTILMQGNGVERDETRAFRMFKAASEQGYVPSQCNLAICYYEGWGTERNLDEALKWFTSAYRDGSEIALSYLQRGYKEKNGNWVKRGLFGHTPAPRTLNPPIRKKTCKGGCMDQCDYSVLNMPNGDACSDNHCYCELLKMKVFIKKKCPHFDNTIHEAAKLFGET